MVGFFKYVDEVERIRELYKPESEDWSLKDIFYQLPLFGMNSLILEETSVKKKKLIENISQYMKQ